jgi:uncharacterized protein (TIGR02270 family)
LTEGQPTYLADLVETHREELAFLASLRRGALRSKEFDEVRLSRLERRMEGHRDGLLVAGDDLPALLGDDLSGEADAAFAAAWTLLAAGRATFAEQVFEALGAADEETAAGLGEALALGAAGPLVPRLQVLVPLGAEPAAVAAASGLSFHRQLELRPRGRERLLFSDSDVLRQRAWRMFGRLPGAGPRELYERGLADADEGVRAAAREAAAWAHQEWLLAHCREAVRAQKEEHALFLLAVLGDPADAAFVLAEVGKAPPPARVRLLGTLGHPSGVELLLGLMESPDPAVAAASGEAFERLTGLGVGSGQRKPVGAEEGFDAEFAEEVELPDPRRAREHWEKVRERYRRGTRWCRGLDFSAGVPEGALASLDFESRWETCLRERRARRWPGDEVDLMRFGAGRAREAPARAVAPRG